MGVSLDAGNALERAIDGKIAKAAAKRTRASGTVTRVDADGTAYVMLDGSEAETPASGKAAEVRAGERVGVTVSGGSLTIDGNYSAPSTDDRAAQAAQSTADAAVEYAGVAASAAASAQASADDAAAAAADAQDSADAAANSLKSVVQGATTVEKAVSVMQTALEAVIDYDPSTDTTTEWFWHDANGAHVLGDTSGYRNDIDSSGMDIKQVSTETSVAHFGASGAQIGKAGESHVELDYHSLKLIDLDNAEYFHVSDLRGHDGFAYYTDTFTGDGTTQRFIISVRAAYNDAPEPTVYIDGTRIYWIDDPNVGAISYDLDAVSQALTFWNVSGGSLGTQYTPANGAEISITYAVDGDIAKSFTFGSRDESHIGPMSSAFGYNVLSAGEISFAEGDETAATAHASNAHGMGTVAASDYQTALGKYNEEDANDTYALIIGNGTADNARSNAAALQWDGTLELAKPLPVASGGTGTTAFGTHYAPTMGATKSVANNTWTQLHNFKLAAGKWLILAYLYAASNTTGVRQYRLTSSSTAPTAVSLDGDSLVLAGGNNSVYAVLPMFVEPSAETTYYMWATQNSGGALNMRANLTAIRLG